MEYMIHRKGRKERLTRTVSLLLGLLFVLSAIMSGTFGWKDLNQSHSNVFTATVRNFNVHLLKLEKLSDGGETESPVVNAEFYIYSKAGDGTETQYGERYVTDSEGKITLNDIPVGDYYFLETNPSYSYDYEFKDGEKINKFPFSVTPKAADQDKNITVKAYNIRRVSDLQIMKTVATETGMELSPAQKSQKFAFTIEFGSDREYEYTTSLGNSGTVRTGDTIYLRHTEIAVIKNLPVGIAYRVTEAPQKGIIISSQNHAGNITRDGVSVIFTNTFGIETLEADSLTISKTVDGDGADPEKKFKFTVTFEDGGTYPCRIGTDPEREFTSGDVIELKHGERAVFPKIPVGLGYTAEEDADGYSAAIKKIDGIILESGVELDFVNHKASPSLVPGQGNLEITKTVKGNYINPDKEFSFTVNFENVFGRTVSPETSVTPEILPAPEETVSESSTQPEESSITDFGEAVAVPTEYHYRIGDQAYSIKSGEKLLLKHGETAVFENLPEGTLYEITEDDYSADGYFGSIKNVSGYIVKNKTAEIEFVNENLASRLTVKKQVLGIETDKEFTFTVTINGKSEEIILKAGEERIFDLPYGAVYEVLEEDYFPEEFIQSGIENGYGTGNGKDITSVKTNAYIGVVMKDIQGTKTWVLPEDKIDKIPETITLLLKNGDLIVQTKTVAPNVNGEWQYQFTVPEFDQNGEAIAYILEEAPINGFVSKIEDFNVTNTYINPITVEMPKVIKAIAGDVPKTDAEFIFKLDAVGEAPMPENAQFGTQLLTLTGAGESSFDNITFETTGIYKYKISELVGDAQGYIYDNTVYDLTVTVTEKDGELQVEKLMTIGAVTENHESAEFVNYYDEAALLPAENTSIFVTKEWKGTSNIPESIQVQLYKDGSAYGEPVTISKADGWQCVWKNLDEHAQWSVDELNVPQNFTKSIAGNAESGFVITNTYTSHPGGTSPGSTNPAATDPKATRTGDDSKTALWITLSLISGGTLWALRKIKRSKRKD